MEINPLISYCTSLACFTLSSVLSRPPFSFLVLASPTEALTLRSLNRTSIRSAVDIMVLSILHICLLQFVALSLMAFTSKSKVAQSSELSKAKRESLVGILRPNMISASSVASVEKQTLVQGSSFHPNADI